MRNFASTTSIALIDGESNILRNANYDPLINIESQEVEFDISTVPNGYYFIHINDGNSLIKQQISISH
jgi:hypothetical protein